MRRKQVRYALAGGMMCLLAVIGLTLLHAADQRPGVAKSKPRRPRSAAVDTQHPRPEYNIRYRRPTDAPVLSSAANSERSVLNRSGAGVSPLLGASSSNVPPPPSPGVPFAKMMGDLQHFHSSGYQTGRISGTDIVHFGWMHFRWYWQGWEPYFRFVHYNSYNTSSGLFNQGYDGCQVSLGIAAWGGYTNLAVGSDNRAHVTEHQRAEAGTPHSTWHHWFPNPGSCLHVDSELASTPIFGEVIWPRIAVGRNAPDSDVVHVISHGINDMAERIVYWRYDGISWEGPVAVDSGFTLGYVLADDPNSDKVAIVLHTDREAQFNGLNNIGYYESNTEGAGFISGAELGDANRHYVTNYTDPLGPQAWLHISTAYDNAGVLHIVWDEQRYANRTAEVAIRHWNDARNTIRPVALGYWPSPQSSGLYDLNLSKLTLGIGDGGTLCEGGATTNDNYLYVLYTRFGGPTPEEQADFSALGWYNGELYLNVSSTGGSGWSPPVNLTNTKTPHCNPGPGTPINPDPPRPDSVCRSEHWATIGQIVDDIDIFFISDLDAGGIILGEGTWQMNPVHYYRIPGGTTDAPYVCPAIQAVFAASIIGDPECEYHAASGGQAQAALTVINLGNAALSGEITATEFNGPPGWLTLTGGGPYSIPPGGDDLVLTVNMNAAGVADGTLLQGQIGITHNDPSQPSPQVLSIDFFVFDEFHCPDDEILKTGVNSPGSLALQVESNGRFASGNPLGGLWRHSDSSSTIFDASFLLAYGPQGTDTVVFHRFGDSDDPGQFGFRAQSDLVIDTSAYGTAQGYAYASAAMSTKDSAIGIRMEWYFPQHPDSDEFVIARWGLYSVDGSTAVPHIVAGVLLDLDVYPAQRYGQVQWGNSNLPGADLTRNLVWQSGSDTAGHIPPDPSYTATRYRGGVRLLSSRPLLGAHVGDVLYDFATGLSSRFLYRTLVSMTGVDLFTQIDPDLYTLLTLTRGDTLYPGDTLYLSVAILSDTLDETSFRATADKAITWARQRGLAHYNDCVCTPCHANPVCDAVTDVLDVVATVGVAFRGVLTVQDPYCQFEQTDVDCNGYTDVLDVVIFVSTVFRGGDPATEFCNPCA